MHNKIEMRTNAEAFKRLYLQNEAKKHNQNLTTTKIPYAYTAHWKFERSTPEMSCHLRV